MLAELTMSVPFSLFLPFSPSSGLCACLLLGTFSVFLYPSFRYSLFSTFAFSLNRRDWH